MALTGPAGAENPSAAFLAGQQHGAALAVQHHMGSRTPAGQKPQAGKPAAPTKPKPGGTAGDALLAQAQAIAKAQTAANVNAILGQQKVYSQQGQQQATDIHNAAQAAADLLQNWNLPGLTSSSYTDAAKALGALASGFSGQTQTDVTNAANAVTANLANLGAPGGSFKTSTGQTVDPTAAANVLYGLGGFIPGNLLETAGQAQTAAARMLPANLLAGAQDKASAAIQAANEKAQSLTPQILEAQGKLPSLTQSIYNDLWNQRFKVGQANEKIAEFNANQALKVQQLHDQNFWKQQDYNFKVTAQEWRQANADRTYGLSYAKFVAAQKAAAAKAKNGGLTAGQVDVRAGKVQDFVKSIYQGVPGHVTYPSSSNGLAAPRIDSWKQKPLTYQQAIRTLVNRFPSLGAAGAINAANQWYKPGEGGRPANSPATNALVPTGIAAINSPTSLLQGVKFGKVLVAPTADRPGVPTVLAVKNFVAALAGALQKPLTIGTGSNHNRMTTDGNVSDHWTGHAADIPLSGTALTQAGQTALILAGMPPAEARLQSGGLYNLNVGGHRVQIIFNSMQGGDHFNHLHIGIE